MKPMVVLFALYTVACGSLLPLAQPPHHPAVVLDPHGRPLDTAEVINARAIHLQAKALEGHHAAVVAPAVISAPLLTHAAPLWGSGLLGHAGLGLAGHGHLLKKRSLSHYALSAPVYAHAPAAVSHQSRVDVISSPAVVSHAVAHAAPVLSHAVSAPIIAHAPAAVSHQSRVDIRTSPAVVGHSVLAAPVSLWGAHSLLGTHAGLSHGHILKKRSLGHIAIAAPAAVSHQSRLDLIRSPAVLSHAVVAPVVSHAVAAPVIAHAAPLVSHVAPAAVSHQSRVDVISSGAHVAPIAYSALWGAPAHLSHPALHHASLTHAAHW